MSSSARVLAGRLQQELADLAMVVDRCEHLLRKALQTGDDGYFDGVALNLHSFFTGVESVLEDIARTVDGSLPSGANWHQELLRQMSATIESVRPPVIQTQTRYCLDEYRSFRHIVRNLYAFQLRPARLTELASNLRLCYDQVASDIDEFRKFLNQLDVT
jgi:hypothetical protein